MTEWFIRRPVGTSLLMVSLVFAGLLGYRQLPVGNVPEVDFPTLVITARALGASATFMERAVTTPLEEKLANIPGIETMRSTSAQDTTTIVIRFRLGRDMNEAANQAQAAIDEASSTLSDSLESPPVLARFNPADQPILLLGLRSKIMPPWELDERARRELSPRLGTIPGVARVSILGGSEKAMRVQYSPVLLAGHRMGAFTLENRVKGANPSVPAGSLDGPVRAVQLENRGALQNLPEANAVPLRSRKEGMLSLSDVGEALNESAKFGSQTWINREPGILLAVRHSPGANSLEVVRAVREMLPLLRESLPADTFLEVLADASEPIGESIRDLQITLLVAVVMVVMVTLIFLGNFGSTLVTCMVVPASLAGTLGFMWLMSYSLDNLSLLALTLAVGFVVDDAVVVLENTHRLVEGGMAPMDAAITGARQIGFTILSMTLSLTAVFLPVLMMRGVVGSLFHEFAITLSVAILLSGVIALFFTPMVCARLIKPTRRHTETENKPGLFMRAYLLTLKPVTAFPLVFLLLGVLSVIWTVLEFQHIPKGFVPADDQNRLVIWTRVRPGTSFDLMAQTHQKLNNLLKEDVAVEGYATLLGINEFNQSMDQGCILLQLRPKAERGSIETVRQRLTSLLNSDPKVMTQVVIPPSIPLATMLYPASLQFTLQSSDRGAVDAATEKLVQAMLDSGSFTNLPGNPDLGAQAVRIAIDGRMCGLLGIDPAIVNKTLQGAYAENKTDTIYDRDGSRKVIVAVSPEYRRDITQLGYLQIESRNGSLIKFEQVAELQPLRLPTRVRHTNRFQSTTISFDPAPGVTTEDAVKRIRKLSDAVLANHLGVTGKLDGLATEYSRTAAGFPPLLLFALLVIYLILGILYESFVHPVTVISGLPSACLGGLLILRFYSLDLDLYGFLGLLLLLGIVKKNAIMVIDFAIEQVKTGETPRQAITSACAARLRPILMTTLAAIVGALPVALGWGAGGESRQPMGLVVVGGLILSQLVTLYLTPAVYLCMSKLEPRTTKAAS